MKISAFNPLILSPKPAAAIELFEALGFEKRHVKTGINDEIASVDMRDANGFAMDITCVPQMPQDVTIIRMTVDNFDEAYELLLSKGFKNAQGGRITETGSSRATMMASPSGLMISISQHIKKA